MAYKYPYGEEEVKYEPPKLNTNRSIWKFIIFNMLTLGIYSIVFFAPMAHDLDLISPKRDRTKTMSYMFAFIVSFFTFTIALWAWYYQISGRVEEALDRRDVDYSFGTGDFWGWFVFGSLIGGIGPFVFIHKLSIAMNLLCADYNEKPIID